MATATEPAFVIKSARGEYEVFRPGRTKGGKVFLGRARLTTGLQPANAVASYVRAWGGECFLGYDQNVEEALCRIASFYDLRITL